MISFSILFFTIYCLSISLVTIVGYLNNRKKERNYMLDEEKINLDDVLVIIPFRNEAHRIEMLLKSIVKLKESPAEFVFVDDHSSDNTRELVSRYLENVNHTILTLDEGISGKKNAIREAISRTKSKFILTLDADVSFGVDYFSNLKSLGKADMYVLPAILVAKKWYEYFFELDVVLANALNAGLSGLSRPIMASGANLFFRREAFELADNYSLHSSFASGDDTFLLRDFSKNKMDVRTISSPDVAIYTETPQSFKEFIDQRLRWIGKTSNLNDSLNSSTTYIQAAFALLFLVIIALFLSNGEWRIVCAIIILKSVVDMLMFGLYFNRINRMTTWLFIPVYELLFPFYSLLLLVLVPTYKPKWKGREIYKL